MKSTSAASKVIAALSRRSFFNRAAVASSAVLLGSTIPEKVAAGDASPCGLPGQCDFPVPIPHVDTTPPGAHIYFPGPVSGAAAPTDPSGAYPEGRDPSLIFNFKGSVGEAQLELTGTGTDLDTGVSARYSFQTDMRFMHGVFVGTDQIERKGSFVFI